VQASSRDRPRNQTPTAEFAESLVAATLSNRSALRRAMHQTRRAGRFVADALQTSTVLKSKAQLGEELEIAFNPGLATRDPERYLDYALSLPYGSPRPTARRRSSSSMSSRRSQAPSSRTAIRTVSPSACAQSSNAPPESAISSRAASSTSCATSSPPPNKTLHQFGGFHDLRPIDSDAWEAGLAERFAADDCILEPGALSRIVDYGELHPRTTMLIAQKSHLASVELETQRIDVPVVDQGLLGALAADRVSHEQTVERIRRLHKLGLVVAERLARGEQVYPHLPRGAVRRALEALRDAAIIESKGRGDWRFANPLLCRYLAGIDLFE
jgi:hypothetical protein